MASRPAARALRASFRSLSTASKTSRRSLVTNASAVRPALVAAARAPLTTTTQTQTRGIKTIDFAGTKETVYGMYTSID